MPSYYLSEDLARFGEMAKTTTEPSYVKKPPA